MNAILKNPLVDTINSNVGLSISSAKYFGNRKDLHDLREQIKTSIKKYEIFHLCQTEFFQNGDSSIKICNLWRMDSLGKTGYVYYRFSIKDDTWIQLADNELSLFPIIPFYPISNDTSFWRNIVSHALRYVAREHGYDDLPMWQEEPDGCTKNCCMAKDKFLQVLLQVYLGVKTEVTKPKSKKSKIIYKGGLLNKREKKFCYGAIALRRDFFKYFYNKEILCALLAINYGYVNFHDYLLFLMHGESVKRVVRERKNMLPLLAKINPKYWDRDDLFSKRLWVRGSRTRTTVDLKAFNRSQQSSLRLKSFACKQGWSWLCQSKIGTVQSWVKNGFSPKLATVMAKADLKDIRCAHIVMKHLFNYLGNTNFNRDEVIKAFKSEENLIYLVRSFIIQTESIWNAEGHKALKSWLNSKKANIDHVFDWLIAEGFSQKKLHKKSSWSSILRHSDDWHHRQVLEAKRKLMERHESYKQYSWDSLLEDNVKIDGVTFAPLTNGYLLLKEGYEMHHCVGGGDYIDACLAGHYMVFSAVNDDGVRSTLGIYKATKDDKTEWVVHQHVTYCNETPPAKDVAAGRALCGKYTEAQSENNNAEQNKAA